MLIAIVGYREWAHEVYGRLWNMRDAHHTLVWREDVPTEPGYDQIYLVGWSEIVPERFYADQQVFVAHPSRLPLYRGGSPIQHQMIEGETVSAVTIFRLLPGYRVDTGPIATQEPYRIRPTLLLTLGEIVDATTAAILRCIDEPITLTEQPPVRLGHPSYWPRRTPKESEITMDELEDGPRVARKIGALQPPYPEPFIRGKGGRLVITGAYWVADE